VAVATFLVVKADPRPPRTPLGPTPIQDVQERDRWRRGGIAWLLGLGALLVAVLGYCSARDTRNGSPSLDVGFNGPTAILDIVDVAGESPDFSVLLGLLDDAGLTETLRGDGPFTVFAPQNGAFAAATLPTDLEAVRELLLDHVVDGRVLSSDLGTRTYTALSGNDIQVVVPEDGGAITAGGAAVVLPDLEGSNGVVHGIDAVVSRLTEAVPPTATVPPETTTTTRPATTTTVQAVAPTTVLPASRTLVDVATEAGGFTTLLSLLDSTGLTDVLSGPGPFTVLAPTDDAFAAIDPAVLAELGDNPDVLARILTFHVLPASLPASALATGSYETVNGLPVDIAVANGTVTVNGTGVVTTPDVAADNGIIHVIDQVLVPPDVDLTRINEDFRVFFDTGSATIGADQEDTIFRAATAISRLPANTTVEVIGHADTTGNAAANQALSEQRAAAVVAALQAQPILGRATITFTTAARGSNEPEADLAQSRRVSIELPS
jgi:uncharacterized surface protein with fasciclin (FAS1) repeats